MKLIVSAVLILASALAADAPKPEPLKDADKLAFRELQLALVQAQAAQLQAQQQFEAAQKRIQDVQPQIQNLIKRLQQQYRCPACELDPQLNWAVPKPAQKQQ